MEKLQLNKIVEVDIINYGSDGEGICKVDNFVVFVPFTVVGDKVKIKIVSQKKTYGYGELIEIITPSADRIAPPCKYFEECGGCTMQHITYDEQLSYKQNVVTQNIKRIGNQNNIIMENIIGSESNFYYRNKVQFPFGMENDKAILGFYKKKSHNVINVDSCMIAHPLINKIKDLICEFVNTYKIPVYNELIKSGLLVKLGVKISYSMDKAMVYLIVNCSSFPLKKELIDYLAKYDFIASVFINYNTNQSFLAGNWQLVYGDNYIIDEIDNTKFKISPQSFYQVNPIQTEKLYGKVLEYLQLTGDETVIDAYCGIGTISLLLAKQAKKVIAIESVQMAINNANENAKINNIDNAEFLCGECEKVIVKIKNKIGKVDAVVVDPPRKGLDVKFIKSLLEIKPTKIVYVSCDSGTLARDLKLICSSEYEIINCCSVDMFCHSSHVESVVLMHRKNYL